ncbi:MAG: hypothetical protein LBM08_12945 [Dysgonamonadaceae bacterium]|jgi:hypothetical protein|nr:hypothetical protein [Dysgonamonadaceae bacterium]
MKKILLFFLLCAGFAACNKSVYVPVESVRTEYRDRYLRDSITLRDSVFIREKGDTVWIEKYKCLYVDKLKRDSIYLNDTIRVPYPVEIPVEVNYVSGWQNFQIWLGRILIAIVAGYCGIRFLRKRFGLGK